jgi:hypothetical protein
LKSTPKNAPKASPKEQTKVNTNLKCELETLEKIKREGDAILDKDLILKRNYLSKFEEDYNTTKDMMYEDLRSKMMAFCDKTNNDKDCYEKYYEDIDDLFRKDLKQYIDRVHNAYLSRLRTVEFFSINSMVSILKKLSPVQKGRKNYTIKSLITFQTINLLQN